MTISLQNIFGSSASLSGNNLSINLNDFAASPVGLTLSPAPDAQAIFVALLVYAQQTLNATTRDGNTTTGTASDPTDVVAITLSTLKTYVSRTLANGTTGYFERKTYNIDMDSADTSTTVNPNDY